MLSMAGTVQEHKMEMTICTWTDIDSADMAMEPISNGTISQHLLLWEFN